MLKASRYFTASFCAVLLLAGAGCSDDPNQLGDGDGTAGDGDGGDGDGGDGDGGDGDGGDGDGGDGDGGDGDGYDNNGGLPPGVIDDVGLPENEDADGYCFDPDGGYYECDDGAPPGTGRPGWGEAGDGDGDGDGGDGDGDGDGDGGDGDGGGTIPPVCIDQVFSADDSLPPRVLLVVDKSGSMDEDANGYNGSKWDGATSALSSVVTALDAEVEFGLMLYPDGTADFDVCREGALEVSVQPGGADAVVDALDDTGPGGGTPTAPTLDEARDALNDLGDQGGNRAVILATDGAPNCNENLNVNTCTCASNQGCDDARNCLDASNTVSAAQALNDAGYAVFVVGIPGSENFVDVLDGLAEAGGTAQAGATKYYDALNANGLESAVADIATRLSTCRFDLEGIVVDDAVVTVGGTAVSRDTSRLNGWDLVDSDTMELFGAACDLATGSGVEVSVEYCFDVAG